MKGIVTDRPLYLNIHSLITVSSFPMPDEVSSYTREKLSLFLTDAPITEQEADIVISQLEADHPFTWTNYHVNLEYGFSITECEGETVIIFAHRAKPDVIVILSDPIKILYKDGKGISDRLFDVLMFCFQLVLSQKKGMFFHGAVAEKQGRCVILTGPFGTKKSMLLLTMLRDNWNFISDDKFVLHGGNAYMLYHDIMMRAYYTEFMPWLEGIMPGMKRFKKDEAFRERVRIFVTRHLPASLLPVLSKLYDPYATVNINADELFPASRAKRSARISSVVLLSDGPVLEIRDATKTGILKDLVAVQRLISYEESKFSSLKERLFLQDKRFGCPADDIIDSNFEGQTFFRFTLPVNCNLDLAYQELKRCLEKDC